MKTGKYGQTASVRLARANRAYTTVKGNRKKS